MSSINGNKQHKKNKQEQKQKHTKKKQTTLLSNITQKTPELQGKNCFFYRLKAKQATRQKQKHK